MKLVSGCLLAAAPSNGRRLGWLHRASTFFLICEMLVWRNWASLRLSKSVLVRAALDPAFRVKGILTRGNKPYWHKEDHKDV